MSLKGFHILFIFASILLSVLVGAWFALSPAAGEGAAPLAAAAFFFTVAAGLTAYLVAFLRKFRQWSSL